ncbi:ATP synthase subunit delta [Methylobacterium thuringiense]|uniref:ATP synthase subunit delta n=1 Tax=Methylobacterium thuringiense TaxID=1003091 RepID=A0ABQ4TPQ3_9HYPH|nr:ATP synthase subunit delta [Methylobacterium thuringiense]
MLRPPRAAGGVSSPARTAGAFPFFTVHRAAAPTGVGTDRGTGGHETKESGQVAQSGSDGTLVSGVAGRYALALFELARDEKQIDEVARHLDQFDALYNESDDLRRLVRSPAYTAEQQRPAIEAILAKAGIDGIAANFIKLTAANRRLFALPDMIRGYREKVRESKGIVRAEVRVAEKPSDALIQEIAATLREVAGSEIELDLKVDPSLIGGIVVKIGSRMVDASLRTKLNGIRLAMRAA